MKNLKAHHHLVIASMLIFGMVGIWSWGKMVFADTSIEVYVGVTDSCPNIPGYQSEVPEGMLVDSDGNCYTPPPPPVDMCANMPGDQETIPDGYYQDANGDCQPQPPAPEPAVDVCPNISGVQASVPDGYVNNADGDCVKPAADMCSNIDGTQVLVPEDMERASNGNCFTPAPPGSTATPTTPSEPVAEEPQNPWIAPETPREPTSVSGTTDLKNIPSIFDPIIAPFVNAIPETIKEALRSVPPIVAQTFPYFTYAVLGVSAAIMGAQTVREVAATRKIALLTKREKDVAEEKDNFIALASHYLRTPLTIMEGALATSRSVKELPEEALAPLAAELRTLDREVNEILADVETNKALGTIKAPEKDNTSHAFITSAFFWIPIAATVLIVILSNFLLGVVGDVELGIFNLLAQAGVYVAVSMLFYSAVRTHYMQRHERAYREKLLKHEEIVDSARNDFIARSTLSLAGSLGKLSAHKEILKGKKAEPFFADGYERFVHLLQKFNLLSEIQAGTVGATEKFDVKKAIDDIIALNQAKLDAKQLTIINNISPSAINQRRSLFGFVFSSLIDNAIKFSNAGGTITISSTPHEHSLTIQVSDYGVGIPEEKASQLFKPFSRGVSAMEFDYEGLGFSLFLDKIIMDYLGGQINASSVDHKNTTFSVTTPTA